jgi:hypothetical protein
VTLDEIQKKAARLYARRHEGIIVPFEDRRSEHFQPEPKECHQNVALWVRANPTHRAVYGWLSFDFSLIGIHRFSAHVVVADENGRLFDVTPSRASRGYPFVRHEGKDDEYFALVKGNLTDLDYRIPELPA